MSENLYKLQWVLERVTAAGDAAEENLGPDAQSLREAWLDFSRLLETAQPASEPCPFVGDDPYYAPLPVEERQRSKQMSRSKRAHLWLWSTVALAAASLMIGVATTWTPPKASPSKKISPAAEQTAAINRGDTTLSTQKQQTVSVAGELPWDDTLDEQIAQIDVGIWYAREGGNSATSSNLLQYQIEQMQKDLEQDRL